MRRIVALGIAAVSLAGCFSVRHAYDGPKLLTPDPALDARPVRVIRHFARHERQFFWLHGGVPTGKNLNGAQLAADEAADHDGVVNLRISDGQDFTDVLISHVPCVLTIFCGSWSVWVEGDVADVAEAGS
jgi:hypothetical protein